MGKNPLPAHGNPSINIVEEGERHMRRRVDDVKTPLRDMMDRKLVQIGCGENIVDVSVIDYSASTPPKPLVVHYTRDAAVRTTNRPMPITIQVPTSFPYKDNKALPWRYDVEVNVGDRQVGETNVDTPNVTNIVGVGGMTRSGRIYTSEEFRTTQSSEVVNEKEKGKEGVSQLPDFVGKQDKFGLGYKLSNADVKRFVEEKEEKKLARIGGREPRTGGVPICDIRESFINAGFEHSNLIAATEGHTQEDVNNNWVRVDPPDAKLPNWEIVELHVIFNFK
ncbi:hypothetical protein SESBI_17902 [Sesbania bispinosa]|nr:hypothetical protein SESBI_17902 [Sesbania bispinosa]